jgi:protein-tyrosine phosphatase
MSLMGAATRSEETVTRESNTPPTPMKSLLFLCSGNYYRSRFAEILFNSAASAQRMPWRADSRGLQLHPENPGPISPHVVRFLEQQGIHLAEPIRFPCQVLASDLLAADLVVAVKETEHRPLLARDFGAWVDRVEFWEIHDVEVWTSNEALPILAARVHDLVRRLLA